MKEKLFKKALAVATSVLMLSGGVPIQPLSQVFEDIAITANAEGQGTQTVSFTTVGSITNIGYFVYVGNSANAVTKPDSINIDGGSAVKVNVAYDRGYTPTLTAQCTVSNSITVTSSDDPGNQIVTYEFTMPMTGNVNVQIQMNPRYSTLTVADAENGTVSVRTPKTSYPTGERVYLDITPDDEYTISTSEYSYYEGSAKHTSQIKTDENGYYIDMPSADTTVKVQFSKIQQIFFDNDEQRGKVELKRPAEEMICENTYVYIKVIPAEGYKLKNISVDSPEGEIEVNKNGEYENEFYFLMPDSYVWVTPVFVTTKKVTVNAAENGTVTIKNDSENVDSGDKVLLEVKPDEGYALSDLWFVTNDFYVHPSDIDENGYYYFTMPEHDVELHAEFVEGRTVTVDLGEGHGELANKFSGISGYTVDGTKISYSVPKDKDTVGEVEWDFSNRAREIALGKVIDADGKKFMGEIRLHSEYQNESLYSEELSSFLSAEGYTFRAMWADPISELTITAPDYKCGQELTTRTQDSTTRYEPCEVQVSEGVSLRDYHLLYTNWLMENNETVLRGGNNYNIYGYIVANYNTYLTDNINIKVEGGEFVSFDSKMSRFEISVPIEHDFGENGVCTYCGELVKCISGASITLADDLALNFYVNGITDENVDQYTVKIEGECLENGQMVALEKNESTGQYYAPAHVTARNTGEKITATLYQGDEVIDTAKPYSVTDYLESAPEKLGLDITQMSDWTTQQQNTYAMIAATQLFCDAASDYFNNTSQFEASYEAYAQASGKTEAKIDAALAAQAANYSFESDNNVFIALSLKNETRIYIYEGDKIKYTIENLLPQQLTLEQTAGEYKFYGLSWADRVFDKQAAGTEVSQKNLNMAKAVTAYALAAAAYAG